MSIEDTFPDNGMPQLNETAAPEPMVFHPAEPFVAEELPASAIPEQDLGEEVDASLPEGGPDEGGEPGEPTNAFNFPAPTPRNNATYEAPYSSPVPEGKWNDRAVIVAIPADTAARTMNYGETNPNTEQADGEQGEKWSDIVAEGMMHGSYHDCMLPAAAREGAAYQQRPTFGNRPLTIAQPRFGDDTSQLLTGKRGMLRVNSLLGRGAIIQVPLWHSGFWITLQMPEEIELLDTFDRIINTKIEFGRRSNGLAFANHAVIDNGAVMDLAMRCLYETTLADVKSVAELRALIKVPDLHLVAWGLACAMHPRGFQFERSVLDPKGVATHVVRENLNVAALLWLDRSSLNDWQMKHMSQRGTGSMSKESIKIYQDHFVRGASKSVQLHEMVSMTLRVPSVDEYLNAGQLWVDELTTVVNEVFTQDMSAKQRNEMIWDRARASSMRQYAHWVESIDTAHGQKMPGREDIANTVASLSADNEIRDKYYAAMKEYINDSTVALIGVPQAHPDEASQALPRFENIIPLDPISVFSSLLSQKIQQIRLRP